MNDRYPEQLDLQLMGVHSSCRGRIDRYFLRKASRGERPTDEERAAYECGVKRSFGDDE